MGRAEQRYPWFTLAMTVTTEELKQLIVDELTSLGFAFGEQGNLLFSSSDKEALRRLHKPATEIKLQKSQKWVRRKLPRYQHLFANGCEIDPASVKPLLVKVNETWHGDLFRLARLLWSLPYTSGFGRRLRYLLFDESNDKLIGILGLQSPPINFPARDHLFQYPEGQKTELVNQMMDIFTLGAIPPYNRLLGGKLVALAAASNEVRKDYHTKYAGRTTEMEERVLPAHLVALTTTSAFGRSSIYNRLKYNNKVIAESLGYTKGYGNFHLQKLYPTFKEYLESEGVSTQGGYGTGPKRSWQLICTVLDKVGLSREILKHGIEREVFLFRLVDNLDDYLQGKTQTPIYRDYPFDDLAQYWEKRWLIGRAERVNGWHQWDSQEIAKTLILAKGTNDDSTDK